MYIKRSGVVFGIALFILLGICGVIVTSYFQVTQPSRNTNQDSALYYDGPRMDVVQFRKILEANEVPLAPGEIRINKIDAETELPVSTTLLNINGVTIWQSTVEQPDGTYILYFEDNVPVKYRLKQGDELTVLTKDDLWYSEPDKLHTLLASYEQEAKELETAWMILSDKLRRDAGCAVQP